MQQREQCLALELGLILAEDALEFVGFGHRARTHRRGVGALPALLPRLAERHDHEVARPDLALAPAGPVDGRVAQMPQIEICVDAVGPQQLREFCDPFAPMLVVWSLSQSVLLWAQLTSAEGDSGGSPGSVGVDAGVTATSADASVRGQTRLPEAVLRGARQRCATATGRGAWPVCPDGWGPSPECNRLGVSRIRRPLWLHPLSRLARGRGRQHRATGPYDQPSLRARSRSLPLAPAPPEAPAYGLSPRYSGRRLRQTAVG